MDKICDFLEYAVDTHDGEVALKRARWRPLAFSLSFSLVLSLFYFLYFLIIFYFVSDKGGFQWAILLFLIPFGIILLLLTAGILIALRSCAISRVQFFFDRRMTIITYLGVFRRSIPDLPTILEIGGGGTGSVWANLCYTTPPFKLSLFVTPKGVVDTRKEAHTLGLQETEAIRNLLKLEVKFV